MNEESKRLKEKAFEIIKRSSVMDLFVDTPWSGNNADFKGFYMLLIYLLVTGFGIEALCDLLTEGTPLRFELLYKLSDQFKYVSILWICLCLYSIT